MSFRLARSALVRPLGRPVHLPSRSLFTRASNSPPSTAKKVASATLFAAGTTLLLVYYFDSRSAIHQYVFTPILRYVVDAETGHKLAVNVLRSGWGPKDRGKDDERLAVELWGTQLSNPIGLAAGFDKDGVAIDGLFDLGFGWVEVGSVTPKPQPGNPQPRMFHLPADDAVINRYGFPSRGHTYLVSRLLSRRKEEHHAHHLLFVNLGKNKSSPPDSIADFLTGIRTFAPLVPVLVINVSSPNTPGLRSLQGRGMLEELLAGAKKERDEVAEITGNKARLVLKIAPDLTEEAVEDLAEVVRGSGVDGVIVSNTTIQRPEGLISPEKVEAGGLSGPPLKPLALRTLSHLRTLLPASIPIVGCGGISTGADAIDFARAGASAVQIYTSFGYGGVGTVRRIKDEVTEELQKLGTTWSDLSKEAVQKLAWKGPHTSPAATPLPPPPPKDAEEGVKALIQEAEDLKAMLDAFAAKFNQQETPDKVDTAIGAAEASADVDTIPPVPPSVVVS